MQYISSLINDLLEKPTNLSTASKYTAMNGLIYLERLTLSRRPWRVRVQLTVPVTRTHASRRSPMRNARSVLDWR